MGEFLRERDDKQDKLKQKRTESRKVQTREAATQTLISHHKEYLDDLKAQVDNLKEIVKQLTSLQQQQQQHHCHQEQRQQVPRELEVLEQPPEQPSNDIVQENQQQEEAEVQENQLSFTEELFYDIDEPDVPLTDGLDETIMNITNICNENQSPAEERTNSPIFAPQTLRQPLREMNTLQTLQTSYFGPSEEQRRRVSNIVNLGTEISTTALASVDALFSDEELATANTSGSRGFNKLDSNKLDFLIISLQRKFGLVVFNDHWIKICERINTKCRGKRRTLVQRLKKNSV